LLPIMFVSPECAAINVFFPECAANHVFPRMCC
jgi:hypothetical protein